MAIQSEFSKKYFMNMADKVEELIPFYVKVLGEQYRSQIENALKNTIILFSGSNFSLKRSEILTQFNKGFSGVKNLIWGKGDYGELLSQIKDFEATSTEKIKGQSKHVEKANFCYWFLYKAIEDKFKTKEKEFLPYGLEEALKSYNGNEQELLDQINKYALSKGFDKIDNLQETFGWEFMDYLQFYLEEKNMVDEALQVFASREEKKKNIFSKKDEKKKNFSLVEYDSMLFFHQLKNQFSSGEFKEITKKFDSIIGNLTLSCAYGTVQSIVDKNMNIRPVVVFKTDTLTLLPDEVIVHELLHAISSSIIENQGEYVVSSGIAEGFSIAPEKNRSYSFSVRLDLNALNEIYTEYLTLKVVNEMKKQKYVFSNRGHYISLYGQNEKRMRPLFDMTSPALTNYYMTNNISAFENYWGRKNVEDLGLMLDGDMGLSIFFSEDRKMTKQEFESVTDNICDKLNIRKL